MANNNISEMTYEGLKSRGIANDLWAPFERAEAYPMDITSVFGSYETAASYAKSGATSYAGQKIAVAGAGVETKIYKITSGGTLVELVDAIALNLKQDVIDDIDEIRSGAELGASALQKVPEKYAEKEWVSDNYGNLTDVNSLKTKVTTLIGEDSGKTVRTIANEEIAAKLIPENAQESLDTLAEIAAWIQEHPEDAAEMNVRIAALSGKSHTHSNFNLLESIDADKINSWTNPETAKSIVNGDLSISVYENNEDFPTINVDGMSNFNEMACFNKDIHLCNNESVNGGFIYFGDSLHPGEESDTNPYAYIGEREDDTLEIKSRRLALGKINDVSKIDEDGNTIIDEDGNIVKEYEVNGIFIDSGDPMYDETDIHFRSGLLLECNGDDEIHAAKFNVPVYADNIPNTIKFNGKTYNVVNGTVNLGNIISQSVSADTSIISDSAITSESSKCIFDEEYPNNGVSIKTITKSDDGESKTYVNVDGESNFNGMACFNENIHLCGNNSDVGGFIYFGDNLHEEDGRHWTYIGERSDDTLEIHSTRVGVGRFDTEDNSIDGVFIGDDSSNMRFNTGLFLRASEDENSIIDATFKVPLYVTSDIHEKGVKLEEKYSSIDHTHEEFASLSGISNTVAEIESTVEDLDSKVYAHGNRLDAIENDCLVLNENKYLQLMNSVFNLGLSECLTNFTTTVYLGKKSDGTYFRPSDYTSNPTLTTEAHLATWNTGSIGYKGFCNTITVTPYDFRTILNTTYLLVKVMSASCTLPSTGVTGGVKKDFGILKSQRTVDGISTVKYYNFAIYSGDTLAIPLTSDYIIPDDFLQNNVIGDSWDSGLFDITGIVYNPSTSFTSRVNMTPFTGTPQGTYSQKIVGSIILNDNISTTSVNSNTVSIPRRYNRIVDKVKGSHYLNLPQNAKIGDKFEIVNNNYNKAMINSNSINIALDAENGLYVQTSALLGIITNVIFDGENWLIYKNL